MNNGLVISYVKSSVDGKILCPCSHCLNMCYSTRRDIVDHLICWGFRPEYTKWVYHGEGSTTTSSNTRPMEEEVIFQHDMHGLLNDLVGDNQVGPSEDNVNNDLLPEGNMLPKITQQVKKMLTKLGLGYQNIHSCPNDCMLFWAEKEKDESCSICGSCRWKVLEDNSNYEIGPTKKKTSKILRWFLLKPRLQRLFISSKTASLMQWHHLERVDDGKIRHPLLRHWKGSLKARTHDPSLTVDEIVAKEIKNESRVNPEQFKELVTRWCTPKYKMTCDVKRMSRLKMQEPHITGTKSFARLAHEEAAKNDGVYPSRGKIYKITRTRKDGVIVNDNVAQIMVILFTQVVSSDSTNTQQTEDDYSNDEYSKVKGPKKHGYIRCVGRMPAVKDNNASCSTDPQTVEQLKDGLARTQHALNVLFNLVKDHIPNANLSGMLNNSNLEVPDNLSMVPNISPLGNRRASSESNHN
uniref:Transposase-associated domain-containing protein n=1 Tax=Lactuca sativa TaxID=4236 RepID=A0A9R1X001_LACSA|nr:hypothetical protein LSAT_V11C700375270 [Lactuca sativa]